MQSDTNKKGGQRLPRLSAASPCFLAILAPFPFSSARSVARLPCPAQSGPRLAAGLLPVCQSPSLAIVFCGSPLHPSFLPDSSSFHANSVHAFVSIYTYKCPSSSTAFVPTAPSLPQRQSRERHMQRAFFDRQLLSDNRKRILLCDYDASDSGP